MLLPAVALLAACSPAAGSPTGGAIVAVGAENEYASVISQIGGKYVRVTAVLSNPSADPHSFESSPSVAQAVGSAQLVVQNGVGYDSFMNKIEAATPARGRAVIDVQKLLGLPDSTPNPHLWYSPATMPAVARAVAARLSALQPAHKAYFASRLAAFMASLKSGQAPCLFLSSEGCEVPSDDTGGVLGFGRVAALGALRNAVPRRGWEARRGQSHAWKCGTRSRVETRWTRSAPVAYRTALSSRVSRGPKAAASGLVISAKSVKCRFEVIFTAPAIVVSGGPWLTSQCVTVDPPAGRLAAGCVQVTVGAVVAPGHVRFLLM